MYGEIRPTARCRSDALITSAPDQIKIIGGGELAREDPCLGTGACNAIESL
jgi:hypothetical protein